MLLSLSGFLFEDDYRTQSVDLARFCRVAASAGYGGVELRRTQISPTASVRQRREMLHVVKDEGLLVTCITARDLPTGGTERNDTFMAYLELCRDMECPLLKVSGSPAWLREGASKAQDFGVALASNNHLNSPLETVEGTRRHMAEVAHANFGLLYDSMHLYLSGEDYLGCIGEFLRMTMNILVHSMRQARPNEAMAIESRGLSWTPALPDAAGVQDWPGIFRAFRQGGYDGLVTVIESGWAPEHRQRVARRCAEAVRQFWRTGRPEERVC